MTQEILTNFGKINNENGKNEETLFCKDFNNNTKLIKTLIEKFTNLKLGNLKKYDGYTKTDLYTEINNSNDTLNIQLKRYTNSNNKYGGQVGKILWDTLCANIPDLNDISIYMKPFFDLPLINNIDNVDNVDNIVDKSKQIKLTKYNNNIQNNIIETLNKNKKQILDIVFYGVNTVCKPQFFCYIEYINKIRNKITFISINDLIKYLMKFDFSIDKSGKFINLGDSFLFTRKGGDKGRITSNYIQFRIKFSKIKLLYHQTLIITF
jgi:hypothetical protein